MGYVKNRINIEQPLSSGGVHKTPQSEFEGYRSTAAVYNFKRAEYSLGLF